MARYVVLARDFDFAAMAENSRNDEGPKHVLADICQRLNATVVSPSSCETPNVVWRAAFSLFSRLYSNPGVWTIAHNVAKRAKSGELVYATGEDLGLTITLLSMLRAKKPALVVSVVWPEKVKPTKLLLAFKRRMKTFVVITEDKARQLRSLAGPSCPEVIVLPAVIDLSFFSPRPPTVAPSPPLVVSAGLVDRDYVTLAAAVNALPVVVDVCAMSSMPSGLASPAYPTSLPTNMTIGSQSLKELRDMYRGASLTVVPLVASNQGAGLTVVWEAMACGCPVVATTSAGDLADYVKQGLVIGVPAENPEALSEAIMSALADPDHLAEMAGRARTFVADHFSEGHYVDILSAKLVAAES